MVDGRRPVHFRVCSLASRLALSFLNRFNWKYYRIGGESLAVAQNTYAVAWFAGKELNLVFGLQLSIARLVSSINFCTMKGEVVFSFILSKKKGSTVNLIVMGPVYDAVNQTLKGNKCLGYALLIASLTCLFSLICAIILSFLDRRRSKYIPSEPVKAGDEIKLSDALKFPVQLWLVFIICVAYYCAIFPFISIGKVFFISKFDFSPSNANQADRYCLFLQKH